MGAPRPQTPRCSPQGRSGELQELRSPTAKRSSWKGRKNFHIFPCMPTCLRFVVTFRCALNVLKSPESLGEANVGQATVCAFASYGSGV